jgi:putative DNA methylase
VTRMIERWFPCAEVSEASYQGWGSGNSETTLFPWFAKRPLAQARAAVLTSLLPWPEEVAEQRRLQDLVRSAMKDYDSAHDQVTTELLRWYPVPPVLVDVFSGRAMIPLEAARYGVIAHGIDYSPVATLAGHLLADFPLRDWSSEPELPFAEGTGLIGEPRLLADVKRVLHEVSRRYSVALHDFYPLVGGKQPWGYLWAVTLPCQECHRRFPLTGSLLLRQASAKKGDPGQSYRIDVDPEAGTWSIVVHDGPPTGQPTRVLAGKSRYSSSGKVAVCPFCDHVHPKDLHTRLAREGGGEDALLLAADLDDVLGKAYREVTAVEVEAVEKAVQALPTEQPFANGTSAVPDETIPEGNTWTVQATVYGARTYGDLCNVRQTLAFVRLARVIAEIGDELLAAELSRDYAAALCGYASAVMVRKLRRSTRGCTLDPRLNKVNDLFATESSLNFSYDYFEAGLGDGPGTWESIADGTIAALRRQMARQPGKAADITRGTALALPFRDRSAAAVVTDPPYDAMIDYTDASDLFYVWLKRSLSTVAVDMSFTADPYGVQEKHDEIIVKKGGSSNDDFRTRDRYDRLIAAAFAEARRVVDPNGVVTIVFGHGEPEVWHRLLGAITKAGLVLTGSWPAKTEKGGKVGFSNIVTTLTMACRPAPLNRPSGRANLVEAEVRREVKARVEMWESVGLAPTDQLMASAGPAMEIVGRYSAVLNHLGEPVEPDRYLLVARRAVEEAAAIEIDHLPLETFDARTRFALSWARLYGRGVAPKSEARWQALASDLEMDVLKGILSEVGKGVRLLFAEEFTGGVKETSAVIDVALAMAKAWPEGLDAVGDVLAASQRSLNDPYLWAAMTFLSSKLMEADPDAIAWTGLVRNKRGIGTTARALVSARQRAEEEAESRHRQGTLFEQAEAEVRS